MTLTEASKITKKGLVYFALSAVVYYFFLLLLLPGTIALIEAVFPEKDPPNILYGPLP